MASSDKNTLAFKICYLGDSPKWEGRGKGKVGVGGWECCGRGEKSEDGVTSRSELWWLSRKSWVGVDVMTRGSGSISIWWVLQRAVEGPQIFVDSRLDFRYRE